MILNTLGGIVSGIRLVMLGDWGVVGIGIALFLGSILILGLVLMPLILLAASAALCAVKGRTIGLVCFGTLSRL